MTRDQWDRHWQALYEYYREGDGEITGLGHVEALEAADEACTEQYGDRPEIGRMIEDGGS